MGKKVKGSLFVDYVRMIKGNKDIDWGKYLTAEDMAFLDEPVADSEWYPFETFERMGLGISPTAFRAPVS